MARHKNAQWSLDQQLTWDGVNVALLMDIRDELQFLNQQFSGLPCAVRALERIERIVSAARRCPKHPRYTGTRRPRVRCAACHRYYKAVWK